MKGKVFKAQEKLRIQLTTDVDITSANALAIKYKKPDETTGSWTATSSDDTNGVIYYDVASSSILSLSGIWNLWAYVTFSDGKEAPGTRVPMTVYEAGSD